MEQAQIDRLMNHLVEHHSVLARVVADDTVDALVARHKACHPDGEYHHHEYFVSEGATIADAPETKRFDGYLQVDCDIPEWANFALVLGYGDGETRVVFKVSIEEVVYTIEHEALEKVLTSADVRIKVGATPTRKS